MLILVPGITNFIGFNLKDDDKLRSQPHNAGRWLGLNRDHRQHGSGNFQLPIQHHIPRRSVEPVHRHAVHLVLDGVEPHLARQVAAQVGISGTNLQCLKCLAGVNGQSRVKITALGVEGGNAAALRTPFHPHGGRGGTIPVGRLICFRRGSDTGTAILPACFTQLNCLKEIVLQLNRISQHPEVHRVAVKGATLTADVETVISRIPHGHVG